MTRNIVAGMMMAAFSGAVYAGTAQVTPNFSPESLTVSASAGMLSGKSHEMVYDEVTGRKISQLDWKIKKCRNSERRYFLGCILIFDAERPRLDLSGIRLRSYGRL